MMHIKGFAGRGRSSAYCLIENQQPLQNTVLIFICNMTTESGIINGIHRRRGKNSIALIDNSTRVTRARVEPTISM